MSAENAAAVAPSAAAAVDIRTARILRYAFGSTLGMAVAMGFDWQLSFLTPVLVVSFLGNPNPRPAIKSLAAFLAIIAVACAAGTAVALLLVPYPVIYLLVLGLLLFHLFHAKMRGAPPLLITWMLIALLVIPILASLSKILAVIVAGYIVYGSVIAVVIVWLAHIAIPDPPTPALAPAAATAQAEPASPEYRLYRALLSTGVVFPVAALFFAYQGASSLIILIFIAILTMQPSLSAGYKAGIALIVGNLIGGIASMIVYDLLVVAPHFGFLVLLTLLTALVFGTGLFSSSRWAPLFGMAFSTTLLIIGSTTSSYGEASDKASTRVIQITIAVIYAVLAHNLLLKVFPSSESSS
jgi:hypothetical protein